MQTISTMKPTTSRTRDRIIRSLFWAALIVVVPTLLAAQILGLYHRDLSIPLVYNGFDDIWQLAQTKVLTETGWILTNPYLGAPGVAHWHANPAGQTSALHSVLMLIISKFISDPVRVQQYYYVLNFPLICATSYIACRLLRVARLPAFCVGMLFAFTTYRLGSIFYAFLANYFIIPLAIVPVIWVMTGHFASLIDDAKASGGVRLVAARLLRSRDFLLGLLFLAVMGVFDGYFAFFTLLLLGFTGFIRFVSGDWRSPLKLVPVVAYGLVLVTTALALTLPLRAYQKAHQSEFAPNGVMDSSLVKHPFEAEVYSDSLKILISPIPDHHIALMGRIGNYIMETSDAARLFKNYRAVVPLGTIGTILFFASLVALVAPAVRRRLSSQTTAGTDAMSPIDAVLAISLFVFLSSIIGGIGTLVALVFPTIRAYQRFPLFLLFALYLGAALVATPKLRSLTGARRAVLSGALIVVTCFGLYDEIPRNAAHDNETSNAHFLADRAFVQKMQTELPANAMVYQYPYSQYQRNSKYYGWGSFLPIRLYISSQSLRWSNGGAKNSPVDHWNERISTLPVAGLLTEVEAVGFKGFVIDGTVMSGDQEAPIRKALASAGYDIYDDPRSKLAFVRLRDPGYNIAYDADYKDLDHIVVTDTKRLLAQRDFPVLVNGAELKKLVSASTAKDGMIITRAAYPQVFFDSAPLSRGTGAAIVTPVTDMKGSLTCKSDTPDLGAGSQIELTLRNQSDFDWHLGDGTFPIRVGVHLIDEDGKMISFDEGFRSNDSVTVKRGTEAVLSVPFESLPVSVRGSRGHHRLADFTLVQDGNAWINAIHCTLPL